MFCDCFVVCLFLTAPYVRLQFVIVVFPDHTHFLKSSDSLQRTLFLFVLAVMVFEYHFESS